MLKAVLTEYLQQKVKRAKGSGLKIETRILDVVVMECLQQNYNKKLSEPKAPSEKLKQKYFYKRRTFKCQRKFIAIII